jgi:NAD-dependent dihydropyrimidine dehydrogenase PreA subunit
VTPTAPVAVGGACTGCGACLLTCPEHAFRPVPPDPGGPAGAGLTVLAARCTGCLECVEVCPADAIRETGPAWTT